MRQERRLVPLLKMRMRNSLSVRGGSRICSSDAPPQGYEKWRLVQFFYQGLSQPNLSMIESMNGGTFLNLRGDLAYKALDKLADNSQQWDFTSCRDKSA
jgi:hypothetical protein